MIAYTDDLAISCKKDMIIASLQQVVTWSAKEKMTLNISKGERDFFSLDCAEADWQPNITIDGK